MQGESENAGGSCARGSAQETDTASEAAVLQLPLHRPSRCAVAAVKHVCIPKLVSGAEVTLKSSSLTRLMPGVDDRTGVVGGEGQSPSPQEPLLSAGPGPSYLHHPRNAFYSPSH